ncbi:MAG: PEP-utilizing enzyme [Chloroflexi bacterium]|nr:PEP-utilizing enzyme [Chloroflexota bacterium]
MTSVEFVLPDPELAEYTWVYENEHGPASQPPLTRGGSFGRPAEESWPPARLVINGYSYYRAGPAGEMPMPGTMPDLGDATAFETWERRWLPEVNALFDALTSFDAASVPEGEWRETLDRQATEFGRVFAGVHGECVLTSGHLAQDFVDGYCEALGEARRADAHALLQGFPNQTLDRAIALWELGREVRGNPGMQAALRDAAATGTGLTGHADFDERFAGFLEEFGHTIDAQVPDAPTWREDTRPALALVLRYANEPEDAAPAQAAAEQVARRERLEQELRALAESDERARELLKGLPGAQELLPVREDHNTLCDQRLGAASRYRWLGIGRLLMDRRLAEAEGDVFYFALEELTETLEGGTPLGTQAIEERRREQAAYRSTQPPPVLGQPLAAEASTTGMLRGTGASPGVYRGRARVIRSLAEADRLGHGEALVCGVTAPTWTPYFAVAGAVVTDAGGALSHTAVVAREYGIPAVVGTRTGTRAIEDGTLIEVDGSEGTVRFLQG